MSSPPADPVPPAAQPDQDDPMNGSVHEEEREGDDVMANPSDDSSEEADEDSDEERKIREGFIVDEDEEDEDESERRRRRKRRRKHRREREREEAEDLDEDDLDLLDENVGRASSSRLTRLRRGSSPAERRPRRVSDEEEDEDDLELPQVQDIQRIWDDDRGGREDEDDADRDDMDDFIEYEDEDEDQQQMNEQERRQKRQEAKQRMRANVVRGAIPGIDANAWDEIHEVFGDGHEYDWALEGEDDVRKDEDATKPELKYQDVFEPSEITARFLTEDDDLIRAQDIPERMQLATSSLIKSPSLSMTQTLNENDLDAASSWVVSRMGPQKEDDFFRPNGRHHARLGDLVQAITYSLRFLFVSQLEVPYIWVHRRDFISYFNPEDTRSPQVDLLSLQDLWRIYALGQKYRALLDRRTAVNNLYTRLSASDDYFEQEIRPRLDAVETVADATEWLNMKYKENKRDFFGSQLSVSDMTLDERKHKLPSRISGYELAKRSIVSKVAEAFGIKAHDVVLNFLSNDKVHFIDDHELKPEAYAEEYVDIDGSGATSEAVIAKARMILATELGKDPLLRDHIRDMFKTAAHVSCTPTERGQVKIDEYKPWFNFKYLDQKPVQDIIRGPQFLQILAAEADHCIDVKIALAADARADFERRLTEAFSSDGYNDTARAWNEERARVVREAIDEHLLPLGVKFARDWIREETEEQSAWSCASILRERINVRPYANKDMQNGETPSVLAMSWGRGDYQKDDITIVYLDYEGRMREHTRIDNLTDPDNQDELADLISRRKPEVIVIGGFSMTTTRLAKDLQTFLDGNTSEFAQTTRDKIEIEVKYVFDEVARLFQHSKRAEAEFGALPTLTKYCIGLARYAQSPLNEYASLGEDIVAVSFDERYQHLIKREKLLTALERTLVDVTNDVGVDINRAIVDSYYRFLLPFVCGLGPRKAQALVQSISNIGGTLVNRDQFIKSGLLTTKIFLNAAGFLRINYEAESGKRSKNRRDNDDVADPLDNTRVHPEDYELARKMATDALELDEEDVQDDHPSHVITVLIESPDREKKLDELNLDDFAVNMYEANGDRKRHTLELIKEELVTPFGDKRAEFLHAKAWDVLTMLSGQTPRTLRQGFIVDCLVTRVSKTMAFLRIDSGIEGTVNTEFAADTPVVNMDHAHVKGKTCPGLIIDMKLDLPRNHFSIELSTRPADVKPGSDSHLRRVKQDEYWNLTQYDRDQELMARKKRAEVGQQRRVIKHPNFHNFNSQQAEKYLCSQQRGDVVIRPSSKGADHLAVTWKVDENLYQHIDVIEPNADPTGQTLGTRFIVEGKYEFSDLDELIVNHVAAMARRVEELMAHEKFKPGEDELHHWLRQFVKANPSKSIYGFTLNRKRPGHFNLCFLANINAAIQTWPVRVTPEAYYLYDTPAAGVSELCDAFKVRHLHESQNLAKATNGGKTPYGGRTPGPTPGAGGATPGRASVRQPIGHTPNPYGTPAGPPAAVGGWAPIPTVMPYGAPPPSSRTPAASGFQTPGYAPPVPSGMNPERARMIQNAGGKW